MSKLLNVARYYYRKIKGDISSNKYIYTPSNLINQESEVSKIFSEIYKNRIWKSQESASGKGSELAHTKILLKSLNQLIADLKIKSMLDAPCGDFNWMKLLDKSQMTYIGMDIVEDLISTLQLNYSQNSELSFQVGNIIEDRLPQVDLIFCRDCLVHLSFEDIKKALANFKKSGSKYLLTTTYIHRGVNFDITAGGWRAINLEKHPFNLPKPISIIHEKNLDDLGMFYDKCMALWDLSELKINV